MTPGSAGKEVAKGGGGGKEALCSALMSQTLTWTPGVQSPWGPQETVQSAPLSCHTCGSWVFILQLSVTGLGLLGHCHAASACREQAGPTWERPEEELQVCRKWMHTGRVRATHFRLPTASAATSDNGLSLPLRSRNFYCKLPPLL